MQIISHRGFWLAPEEKNSIVAFERSFSLGYGTETDVRDCAGKLLISHDPPYGDEIDLDALLSLAGPEKPLLAINIKADGLAARIRKTMEAHDYTDWFVFDMSIPDTRGQFAAGNPVYMRLSEIEPDPPFLDKAAGIWLDAFTSDEWRLDAIDRLVDFVPAICLVSPELHSRPHLPFWEGLRTRGHHNSEKLTLCTDLPTDAASFFGVAS